MVRRMLFGITVLLVSFIVNPAVYAESPAVEALLEEGLNSYKTHDYEGARDCFQKVMIVSPSNKQAHQYLHTIRTKTSARIVPVQTVPLAEREDTYVPLAQPHVPLKQKQTQGTITYDDIKKYAMDKALDAYEPKKPRSQTAVAAPEKIVPLEKSAVYKEETRSAEKLYTENQQAYTVRGEIDVGMGIEEGKAYWNRSSSLEQNIFGNKPWQYMWGPRRYNSYDQDIYQRFSTVIDTREDDPRFSSHLNIVIDPYSFIGRADVDVFRLRSRGADGTYTPHSPATDVAHITLKYFPASNLTVDEIYRSESGNIVTVPPTKVKRLTDTVAAWASAASETWGANDPHIGEFFIPETDLDYTYRVIREWFYDYKDDTTFFRVFPFAYEDQAYFSDDPLKLSGNKIFWEENPWIDYFEPSVSFNRPGSPVQKASWVRKYSFLSKDMDLRNLTLLRGMRLNVQSDALTTDWEVAAPLNFWEDYDNLNTINQAFRLKQGEDSYIGLLITSKLGIYKKEVQGKNFVGALDGIARINGDLALIYEGAYSYTAFNNANDFEDRFNGIGAYAGMQWKKVRLYAAYLDDDFYPALSSYRYTRDDAFYGKYILFDTLSDEEEAFKKGNSIERGRFSQGLSYIGDVLPKILHVDFDARHVYDSHGDDVETITRWDTTWNPLKRLTFKSLVWYQFLPKTMRGKDPLITADRAYTLTDFFSLVNEPLENQSIVAGENPSIGWFGIGAKCDLTNQVSLVGVYQRTNDPRDYPRTLLTNSYYVDVWEEGVLYDKMVPFLYDQQFFDLPPYDYYNILKLKALIRLGKADITLSYTDNDNKYDAGIDDNVNHIGCRLTYPVNDHVSLTGEYTYSKFIDVYEQVVTGAVVYEGHHNFFAGLRYSISKEQFIDCMFGQVYAYVNGSTVWALGPADTVHLFRLRYRLLF